MKTINDLYMDAILFEQPFVAYGIFLLAQRGLVDFNASEDDLNFDPLSFEEINAAIKENVLKFNTVNLYTLKIEGNHFAFILANSEEDAVKEFIRVKHRKPVFTVLTNDYMDRTMYDEQTKKHISFREERNQTKQFPHYVCDFEKTN